MLLQKRKVHLCAGSWEEGCEETIWVFAFVGFLLQTWVCTKWRFPNYHLILYKEGDNKSKIVYNTIIFMVISILKHKKNTWMQNTRLCREIIYIDIHRFILINYNCFKTPSMSWILNTWWCAFGAGWILPWHIQSLWPFIKGHSSWRAWIPQGSGNRSSWTLSPGPLIPATVSYNVVFWDAGTEKGSSGLVAVGDFIIYWKILAYVPSPCIFLLSFLHSNK